MERSQTQPIISQRLPRTLFGLLLILMILSGRVIIVGLVLAVDFVVCLLSSGCSARGSVLDWCSRLVSLNVTATAIIEVRSRWDLLHGCWPSGLLLLLLLMMRRRVVRVRVEEVFLPSFGGLLQFEQPSLLRVGKEVGNRRLISILS